MTVREYQEMVAQHHARMREMERAELQRVSPRIEAFKAYAGERGVQLTDNAFHYSPQLGVTASTPGLLRSLLDVEPNGRDGLYDWKELAQSGAV